MNALLVIFDFNRTLYNIELSAETPGGAEAVTLLKNRGSHVCIVSRRENNMRFEFINRLSFIKLIDEVVYIESDNKGEAYEKLIEQFSVSPGATIVIGDYLEKDIKPAIAIGCKTIWLAIGKYSYLTPIETNIYPDLTIYSLNELVSLFSQ